MSALTSLLVRDQILSVRKIEQALERQVTDGGDLETILLEMDVVQENVLSAYRAVLFGLLPGTRDEVMKAPPEVTGLVPKDLALKHNFVPLSSDGKLIVIALAEPLSIDARREVQKVLDQEIAYRVVTPIRVIAGLAQHYGRELDAKFRRLIDRLQDRAPGIVPYVAPPPTGGRVAAPTPVVGLRAQQPVAPPSGSPTSPGSVRARRRSHGHWGPLTANQAAKRLDVLSDRDEILDLYLVFASQFLEYVAVFVVQGDLASGRDALGNGPDGEYLRGLAVPLDVPGSFAEVRSMRVPAVVDLTKSELDRIVATDLDRVAAQPSLLVPVVLRGRVVAFLYGDRAGERFTLSDVPEVLGLSVRVGDALERGILARKGIATPMHVLPEHDAGPTPSVVPRTRTTPPESVRRPEPGPHDVLGVPRSAPPPPKRSQVPVEAKAPEPSPVPRVEPSIHPNAAEPRRSAPPTVGSYHVHSALPEVVETRPSRAPGGRASARPAERASVRPAETPSAEPVARASVRPVEAAPPASSPPVSPASVSVPPASNPPVSNPPRASGAPRRQSARPDPRREDGTASVVSEVVHVPSRISTPPTDAREDPTIPDAKPIDPSWRPRSRPPGTGASIPPQVDTGPSVIVNMGEGLERIVEELTQCAPDEEGAALHRVLRSGEAVLPVLVRRFPGPLWFDRSQPHAKVPRGNDISAIARAIVAFKETALPYVSSLLDHSDAGARFYAVLLATEFTSEEVLVRLVNFVFDPDPGTRRLAIRAVRAAKSSLKTLEETLKSVRNSARHARGDVDGQVLAILALGELQDRRSVTTLVELVGAAESRVADAARHALVEITRQDFGASQKRWQQWFDKNHERHRIEWLFDALVHSNEEIRGAAGAELLELTGMSFGFTALSSRRDREAAQQRYRDWWNREGYLRMR